MHVVLTCRVGWRPHGHGPAYKGGVVEEPVVEAVTV